MAIKWISQSKLNRLLGLGQHDPSVRPSTTDQRRKSSGNSSPKTSKTATEYMPKAKAIATGHQNIMVLEITECSLFLTVLSFVFLLAASMSFYMASHDDCQTSTSEAACSYFQTHGVNLGIGMAVFCVFAGGSALYLLCDKCAVMRVAENTMDENPSEILV